MWEVVRFALTWFALLSIVLAVLGYYRAKFEMLNDHQSALNHADQNRLLAYRAEEQHKHIVINGDYIRGTYGEYLPPEVCRVIQHDGTIRRID